MSGSDLLMVAVSGSYKSDTDQGIDNITSALPANHVCINHAKLKLAIDSKLQHLAYYFFNLRYTRPKVFAALKREDQALTEKIASEVLILKHPKEDRYELNVDLIQSYILATHGRPAMKCFYDFSCHYPHILDLLPPKQSNFVKEMSLDWFLEQTNLTDEQRLTCSLKRIELFQLYRAELTTKTTEPDTDRPTIQNCIKAISKRESKLLETVALLKQKEAKRLAEEVIQNQIQMAEKKRALAVQAVADIDKVIEGLKSPARSRRGTVDSSDLDTSGISARSIDSLDSTSTGFCSHPPSPDRISCSVMRSPVPDSRYLPPLPETPSPKETAHAFKPKIEPLLDDHILNSIAVKLAPTKKELKKHGVSISWNGEYVSLNTSSHMSAVSHPHELGYIQKLAADTGLFKSVVLDRSDNIICIPTEQTHLPYLSDIFTNPSFDTAFAGERVACQL